MYKCEISKTIWLDDQKRELYEVLVKNFLLPFPPFLGLNISSGKFHSGDITSISWDADNKIFSLMTRDEIPWTDDDGHLHTAEEIKTHYIKRENWEIML